MEIIWVVLGLLVVAAIAVASWMAYSKRRSEHLKDRFGPEYERAEEQHGSRRAAEAELAAREKRRDELDIRPLTATKRYEFTERWSDTKSLFVDSPSDAVIASDALVQEVMRERGYPVENFEQRAADLSVDHPQLVRNYRAAHDIAMANQRGDASTEDLRQAVLYYGSLFEELLAESDPELSVVRDDESEDEIDLSEVREAHAQQRYR